MSSVVCVFLVDNLYRARLRPLFSGLLVKPNFDADSKVLESIEHAVLVEINLPAADALNKSVPLFREEFRHDAVWLKIVLFHVPFLFESILLELEFSLLKDAMHRNKDVLVAVVLRSSRLTTICFCGTLTITAASYRFPE